MCELFALSSKVPTTVAFSLRAFSQRGGPGGPVDGWGIAFHDGRDVRLYKEPEPARDNAWVSFIASRRLASSLVISHLRHATEGGVSYANTQPFIRELGGRIHVFAHNGRLAGLNKGPAKPWRRFMPVGDTDSETAFCMLLEKLSDAWAGKGIPGASARLAIVSGFAAEMRELGPANFLYSDGDLLFAHGHRRTQADQSIAPPGLWKLDRRCAVDTDALAESGVAIEGCPQEITLFASVPLTDESWSPLAAGEVICVKAGRTIEDEQIAPAPAYEDATPNRERLGA